MNAQVHCQDTVTLTLLLFAKCFDNKCTDEIFLLFSVKYSKAMNDQRMCGENSKGFRFIS